MRLIYHVFRGVHDGSLRRRRCAVAPARVDIEHDIYAEYAT